MAGEMTRQAARSRLDEIYQKLRDRYIPEDTHQPVQDGTFWEWEEMADAFDREMTGALLEVLAQLSQQAKLAQPGACSYCGSRRVRWLAAAGQRERQSKHGPVVVPRQVARCRSCGRSFSPAGASVGSGCADRPDAAGTGQSMSGSQPVVL